MGVVTLSTKETTNRSFKKMLKIEKGTDMLAGNGIKVIDKRD